MARTGQSRPKLSVLYARKHPSLKKVHHRRSWQWWLLWARDDDCDYDGEDDGDNDDLATQVVDSSKETVDAMFFLTEEEERAAR